MVGGLIAVVQELRQNQAALNAQAYQARAFDAINTLARFMNDPEISILASGFESGDIDIKLMTPAERDKLFRYYFIRRTDLDNEHYQYQNGFLDSDFYHTSTEVEIKILAPFWRQMGIPEPRQSFTAEVDRILADPTIHSINK